MTGPALAVRVFPAGQAGQARAWVRALAAAIRPPAADDAGLAATEPIANAIAHIRSGRPGGTVTVAVIAWADGVTIHVHDQGTGSGQVPAPRPAADDADELAEGGRACPSCSRSAPSAEPARWPGARRADQAT